MKRTAHSFLPFLYMLVALALTCIVSCCYGAAIGHFIAYSPVVPIVRKILVALGSLIVLSAIAIKLKMRKQKKWLRDCDSDVLALRCFTLLLIIVPFACNVLATYTYCDFYFLQCSISLLFFVTGSLVAIRAKRYRYILFYFTLFIVLGGLVPPS